MEAAQARRVLFDAKPQCMLALPLACGLVVIETAAETELDDDHQEVVIVNRVLGGLSLPQDRVGRGGDITAMRHVILVHGKLPCRNGAVPSCRDLGNCTLDAVGEVEFEARRVHPVVAMRHFDRGGKVGPGCKAAVGFHGDVRPCRRDAQAEQGEGCRAHQAGKTRISGRIKGRRPPLCGETKRPAFHRGI